MVWERLTALWPSWAKRIGSPALLRHVMLEWRSLLGGLPAEVVERAISGHWRDHGAKYQPDQADIAARCDAAADRPALSESRRNAEQAYYKADAMTRLMMEANSLVAERGHADGSAALRIEHELRGKAQQALRLARSRLISLRRHEADPWPPGESGRRLSALLKRDADRGLVIAERVCRMAGVAFVRPDVPEEMTKPAVDSFAPPVNRKQIERRVVKPPCPF